MGRAIGPTSARALIAAGQAWTVYAQREQLVSHPEALSLLKRATASQLRAGMWHLSEARSLQRALSSQSVPSLHYKGIALAIQTTGSLASRRIADLDVLVRPQDVPEADRVLQGLGWHPKPGSFPSPPAPTP